MAENNSYEPENDLNLEESLNQDDVYTPENDLELQQSLVSTIAFATSAANATGIGRTSLLSNISATLNSSAANVNAKTGTVSVSGTTTIPSVPAGITGSGRQIELNTFTTIDNQSAVAGGLGEITSISGSTTVTAQNTVTEGTGVEISASGTTDISTSVAEVLSNKVLVDDFSDGDVNGWTGDTNNFNVVDASFMPSSTNAKVDAGNKVSKTFAEAVKISFDAAVTSESQKSRYVFRNDSTRLGELNFKQFSQDLVWSTSSNEYILISGYSFQENYSVEIRILNNGQNVEIIIDDVVKGTFPTTNNLENINKITLNNNPIFTAV